MLLRPKRPSAVAAIAGAHGRRLQDAHAERPRPLEQQPVELPAVDDQALLTRILAYLGGPLPLHAHGANAPEPRPLDGLAGARHVEQRQYAGAQRLAELAAGKRLAFDQANIMAELGQASGEGAACRPGADDADRAHADIRSINGSAGRHTRRRCRQSQIGPKAIMQPASDIVAGGPAAPNHFVM